MSGADPVSDFGQRYGPWAIIVGASEGIGASLADRVAEAGINLVLVARNEARLDEVAASIRGVHGVEVRTVVCDLTDPMAGSVISAATNALGVGLLIYAAGAANRSTTFLEESLEESLDLVRLNCIGPLALAREFAPPMRERGRGGIVLVGSMACLAGAAQVAVYSAVKMFGVNFAEGLWAEFHPHGVEVCNAVLGSVNTPAAERQGVASDSERDMEPADVAEEILENIGNGPTHVVGAANRAMASLFWPVDRRAAVELMSAATREYATRTAPPTLPPQNRADQPAL